MIFEKYYLVGIGGVSMSGLARVLKAMGKQVSGSDQSGSEEVDRLRLEGIEVKIGHFAENVPADTQVLVYSQAISEDNAEMQYAKKMGITLWSRSRLIGAMMQEKIGIAVAGMHGKSTVSAMLATILEQSGEDPTILVGAEVKAIGNNAKYGKSDLVVAEACEYKRSFLDFEPTVAILTNIEEEHMDIYRDLDDIIETFTVFSNKIPKDGLIVACFDDDNVVKVIKNQKAIVAGYGWREKPGWFDGAYWQLENYKIESGVVTFEVVIDGEKDLIKLQIPGRFNALNAVASLIVADFLMVDREQIKKSLFEFGGAGRRFELIGSYNDCQIIDDYGHHPTEIKNLLMGVKEFYSDKKIWVVFQPHQYSRTYEFLDDFAKCFELADKVILADIYEARDTEEMKKKVNSQILAEKIAQNRKNVEYLGTGKKIVDYLKNALNKDVVLLTVGAGDIYKIGRELIKSSKK